MCLECVVGIVLLFNDLMFITCHNFGLGRVEGVGGGKFFLLEFLIQLIVLYVILHVI